MLGSVYSRGELSLWLDRLKKRVEPLRENYVGLFLRLHAEEIAAAVNGRAGSGAVAGK